jgi:hypothetical protein
MSMALLGCSEKRMEDSRIKQENELKGDLKVLENERIFFGHQSVGGNIIEGLRDIIKENPDESLQVQHWVKDMGLPSAFFLEGLIGENLNPKAKCDDYTRVVDELGPKGLSIALMKFCYLDITRETDLDRVFGDYVATVRSLQQRHPATTFVHVTVPLTTDPDILRRVYRFLRGRSIDHDADNEARERFNDRLRKEFATEPIFDLAAIESTRPDGTREERGTESGKSYGLVKEYASDEGHLNEIGRKIVAREFVRALAQIARDHKKK